LLKGKDLQKAYDVIKSEIRRTPVISEEKINSETGNIIFLKLENLQKTGAFKIRGVLNKINSLSEKEKEKGVICASSGSHGIAVSYVSKIYGIKSKVIVPEITPEIKINKLRNFSEVKVYGESYYESYLYARKIAEENNLTFIHGFDDPFIIAGQGTVGMEIFEQVKDFDFIIAPIGGGGLISGLLVARNFFFPDVKVIGVQAEGAPSMFISWKEKRICELSDVKTIAEGIAVKKPGELNFSIVKKYIDDIVLVSDEEIKESLKFFYGKIGIGAETAGVASFAAVLFDKLSVNGKKIVCVVSGGNISSSDLFNLTGIK